MAAVMKSTALNTAQLANTIIYEHNMMEPKKKAVNAFMAFRSYSESLFPGIKQKEKSPYIRYLWANELLNAKWTLVAAAFTVIRDTVHDTKKKPKLKQFLKVIAPFIGIPEVTEYFDFSGYRRITIKERGEDIHYVLRRKAGFEHTFDTSLCSTNLSIEDLVAKAIEGGCVKCPSPTGAQYGPLMAMVSAPNLTHLVSSGVLTTSTVQQPEATPSGWSVYNQAHYNPATVKEGFGPDTVLGSVIDRAAQHVEDVLERTSNYQVPAEFTGWDNTTTSFDSWIESYLQQLRNTHLGDLNKRLIFHGGVDDTLEFGNGLVQTDFNPYAGDSFTAYNISAPVDEMWDHEIEL